MTSELRTALVACHRRQGWLGGYPLAEGPRKRGRRPESRYALTLWVSGICTQRYELWRREYLDAYRVWQQLEHPVRRKPYSGRKVA